MGLRRNITDSFHLNIPFLTQTSPISSPIRVLVFQFIFSLCRSALSFVRAFLHSSVFFPPPRSSVRVSTFQLVHRSVHLPFIYSSVFHSVNSSVRTSASFFFNHSSVFPSELSFIRPYVRSLTLFVLTSVCSFIDFVRAYVCAAFTNFVRASVRSFVRSSVRALLRLCARSCICLFIHSSVRAFVPFVVYFHQF